MKLLHITFTLITVLTINQSAFCKKKGQNKAPETMLNAVTISAEVTNFPLLDELKSNEYFEITKLEGKYFYNFFPNVTGLNENRDLIFEYYKKEGKEDQKTSTYCIINREGDIIDTFDSPENTHFWGGDYIAGPAGYCNWLINRDTILHSFDKVVSISEKELETYHHKASAVKYYKDNRTVMLIDNEWYLINCKNEAVAKKLFGKAPQKTKLRNGKTVDYTSPISENDDFIPFEPGLENSSVFSLHSKRDTTGIPHEAFPPYVGLKGNRFEILHHIRHSKIELDNNRFYSDNRTFEKYEGMGYYRLTIANHPLEFKYPTDDLIDDFEKDSPLVDMTALHANITDKYALLVDYLVGEFIYIIKPKQ